MRAVGNKHRRAILYFCHTVHAYFINLYALRGVSLDVPLDRCSFLKRASRVPASNIGALVLRAGATGRHARVTDAGVLVQPCTARDPKPRESGGTNIASAHTRV